MSIRFRVTKEEMQNRNYAQFKGVSISSLIKEAVFDQMETELDIMVYESNKSSEELKRILEIE